MSNSRGFTYFAWLHPSRAGHGFLATFTDKDGNHVYLSRGQNDRGEILFRRFKFSPSKRMLIIPNSQQDVIEFLRAYPLCKGSPNGDYVYDEEQKEKVQLNTLYKEVNEGKDAKVGIDATKEKLKATTAAMSLDPEDNPEKADELKQVAVQTGHYSNDPGLQFWHVIQFAENSPERFLEIYKDPTKKAKYIINEGLNGDSKVLRKKGFMIFWQDVHLGNKFDDAVQTILADEDLMKAIEEDIIRSGK